MAKSLQDKYLASKGHDVKCQGGLGKSPHPGADHVHATGAINGVAGMVNNLQQPTEEQLPQQQSPAYQPPAQQGVENDSINQIPSTYQNVAGPSQDELAMNEGKVLKWFVGRV